mmetsp:Transcript_62092/g.115192  ORF Transcript_62092/g.115192 Transcript_62092/m.115192 type:complete len:277 (-) Transcript_62092:44-874(-)
MTVWRAVLQRTPTALRQWVPQRPAAGCSTLLRGQVLPRDFGFRALAGTPSHSGDEGGAQNASSSTAQPKLYRERLLDGEEEILTEAEKTEKEEILRELTRKLSGPLADENGNVPTGKDRPIAIEVDGPSHFYANSTRYTAYTKLKHRLLTRMGYKVVHVPYFEWRKQRGAKEREEYMRKKLLEEPTEWLDPEDEKYYTQAPAEDEEELPPPPPPPQPATGRGPARPAQQREVGGSPPPAPPKQPQGAVPPPPPPAAAAAAAPGGAPPPPPPGPKPS